MEQERHRQLVCGVVVGGGVAEEVGLWSRAAVVQDRQCGRRLPEVAAAEAEAVVHRMAGRWRVCVRGHEGGFGDPPFVWRPVGLAAAEAA